MLFLTAMLLLCVVISTLLQQSYIHGNLKQLHCHEMKFEIQCDVDKSSPVFKFMVITNDEDDIEWRR